MIHLRHRFVKVVSALFKYQNKNDVLCDFFYWEKGKSPKNNRMNYYLMLQHFCKKKHKKKFPLATRYELGSPGL